MKTAVQVCRNFYLSLLLPELRCSFEEKKRKQMIQAVEEARREWHQAYQYFDEVTDLDLIEYAVYLIETTRRKYTYLLRKSRELKISL